MADSEERDVRTLGDIERTVKVLGRHFGTDLVVIIGSQAIQIADPNVAEPLRISQEIDAYPANAREWEAAQNFAGAEASEEINGLFGVNSHFHDTYGFYIDGVDDTTATLPVG